MLNRDSEIVRTPSIVKGNKSLNLVWSKWGSQWWSSSICCYLPLVQWLLGQWGILKHFPQSRMMYLYLSLVERKVAEFYHKTWLKWLVFIVFFRTIDGVFICKICELWSCVMNSTLGSVVPSAMFLSIHFNSQTMFRRSGPVHTLLHTVKAANSYYISFSFWL